MSSAESPSDKIHSVAEVMPQRDSTEGTVDLLNEAPQCGNCKGHLRPMDLVGIYRCQSCGYINAFCHEAKARWMAIRNELMRDGQPAPTPSR